MSPEEGGKGLFTHFKHFLFFLSALYGQNDMTSVGLHWDELLMPLLQKYKLNITWGDQDLINIIFHYNPGKPFWISSIPFQFSVTDVCVHPEMVFTFPCHWNYRPDHCIYGSNCIPAEEEGVLMLHGNRGVFHSDKQPAFKAVYDAFKHVSCIILEVIC